MALQVCAKKRNCPQVPFRQGAAKANARLTFEALFFKNPLSSSRIRKLAGSASMQTIVPQLLGMALFFAFSKWLPKEAFGQMGWCTATAYLIATFASFGLEQVVFRRLAAGGDSSNWAAKAFWVHNLATAALALLLLLGLAAFSASPQIQLLPFFFAAQAALSLAMPFRLLLNARLQYGGYAFATITANLVKLAAAYGCHKAGILTLPVAAAVLVGGNALEYGLAWLVARKKQTAAFRPRAYRLLIKEALPQYLTVIFDVSLARLDWFLLGILASAASVAEYSFAYRAYEVEKLPAAIVGSLLLPIVARWWTGDKKPVAAQQQIFTALLLLIPALMGWASLLVVLLWQPLVGGLLQSEFGSASFIPLAILNLSMVLQFSINLLWVQTFAARQYRKIALLTAATALLSLFLNLVLIPKWQTTGAALSLLLAAAFQLLGYARQVQKLGVRLPWKKILFVWGVNISGICVLLFCKMPLAVSGVGVLLGYPLLMWMGSIFAPAHRKILTGLKQS